ncbi:hypothetical protein AGMMS50267_01400 [Spirochaetia bacterium]|nr:hypothetical protein AGMMS50267_01400 [Spirochaetia bacterium]
MSHLAESPVIILVGPKHAGKTSVGRVLAALLGGRFTDLDEYVELLSGKSPRSLYKEGAEVFRRVEAEALGALLGLITDQMPNGDKVPAVIAAGGGLVDNRDALALLNGGGGCSLEKRLSDRKTVDRISADKRFKDMGAMSDDRKPVPLLVNLEVSTATAWARIERSAACTGELPPFINTADPQETHRLLHERRAAAYREIASFTVQGEGKTPEELGREIFQAMSDSRINSIYATLISP